MRNTFKMSYIQIFESKFYGLSGFRLYVSDFHMQGKEAVTQRCEILYCGSSAVSPYIVCFSLVLLCDLYYLFLGNTYFILHYW